MNTKTEYSAPNLLDMKKSIIDIGGMFYQYRPCRRNAATIYDIENIRHGVVYAQTPLNMNDPFDSMMGFSAEDIYNEIVTMLLNAIEMDENTKTIISFLLCHRAFGKLAELITSVKDLKSYLVSRQREMHQMGIPFQMFVSQNAKRLYSKLPKNLKNAFIYKVFLAFAWIIGQLGDIEISEESITDLLQMEGMLDELHAKAEEIQEKVYQPAVREFLSKVTISCFSASGWNNQLMWAHYANSYSGLCIEYDFSKMSSFVGFVYPVIYTEKRPTLSLEDLGIAGIDINAEDDKLIHCETNLSNIFQYLLSKNTCWIYEDEWRIINIGEPNTPLFIDFPFICSITIGTNIDEMCKRLVLDVCRSQNITCYQLVLDKTSFMLHREIIDFNSLSYNTADEIDYLSFLSEHFSNSSRMLVKDSESIMSALKDNKFEGTAFHDSLANAVDLLCDSYYIKTGINRICENYIDDFQVEEIPDELKDTITGINEMVKAFHDSTKDLNATVFPLALKGVFSANRARELLKLARGIQELTTKIDEHPWHPLLAF